MVERIEKNPLLSLLLFCIGLYFFNLEQLQVTIMEARNFLVTREMLTDGNWLLTTMNGMPRYEKPPAPAWFSVPFAAASGVGTLFWLRVPTSLMALVGIFVIYFWVKAETGNIQISLMSALILATSFYYLAIRFEGPSDTYTHVFLLTGIYALHLFLKRHRISLWLMIIAAVFTGLSVLSKGPVGIYALLLPFIIAWLLVYKAPALNRKLWYLSLFLMLSLVVGGSWYLYVRMMDPETFVAIASRETGNWTSYNVRPFYYYWSFFVQSGVWALPALLSLIFYPWIKNRTEYPQLYKFSLIWTLLSVILLSLIPEKKSRYLVPVLIPMAICTSVFLYTYIRSMANDRSKIVRILKYPLFGIAGVAGIAFLFSLLVVDFSGVSGWCWYLVGSLMFLSTGLLLLYVTWRGALLKAFYLIVGMHVLIVVFGLRILEYLPKNENYRSVTEFENPHQLPLYSVGNISPEVIWEVGQSLPILTEELLYKNKGERLLVFTDHEDTAQFVLLMGDERRFELVDSFDRNLFSREGNRGYRLRHQVDVYLVH